MNKAPAVAEPCQAWLPGFSQPVLPPEEVGPLLRLPVLHALPTHVRRYAVLLLGRDRYVGELARDVPLLFYLLLVHALRSVSATTESAHEVALNLGCRLARMPRVVLLETLGMERRPAVVRFLARCGYHALHDPQGRHYLNGACSWWWDEWMTRWQVPHVYLLTTVESRFWRHVALALDTLILQDPTVTMDDGSRILPGSLCGVPVPKDYRDALERLVSLVRRIDGARLDDRRRNAVYAGLQRCRTLGHVALFSQQLDETIAVADRLHDEGLNAPLATPPRPATSWIVPINTLRGVIEEGEEMHHCLGDSYLNRVATGNYYVYRVLTPLRLTVGLARNTDGTWRLDGVCGFANAEAPADLRRRIECWMEGNMDFDNLQALQEGIRVAIAEAAEAIETSMMSDAKTAVYQLEKRTLAMTWTDAALAEELRQLFASAYLAIIGATPEATYPYQRAGIATEKLADAQRVIERVLEAGE